MPRSRVVPVRSVPLGVSLVSLLVAVLVAGPTAASDFSKIVHADRPWDHDIHYATADQLAPVCSGLGSGGASSDLPTEMLEDFAAFMDNVRRLRTSGKCARSADDRLTEPCRLRSGEPCPEGSLAAIDSLVASNVVILGSVAEIVPAYDFSTHRAVSMVFVEVAEVYPGRALGGTARISFVNPWGDFMCQGLHICTRSAFSSLTSQPDLAPGVEVFLGGYRFEPQDQHLILPLARIFKISGEVAQPLSFNDLYTPDHFSVTEARAQLAARQRVRRP